MAVTVYFNGDASALKQATEEAANAVRDKTAQVNEQFQTVAGKAGTYASQLAEISGQAEQRVQAASQAAGSLGQASNMAAQGLAAMGKEDLATKIQSLEARLQALSSQAGQVAQGVGTVRNTMDQAVTTLDGFRHGAVAVEAATDQQTRAFEQSTKSAKGLSGGLGTVSSMARDASQAIGDVSVALDAMSSVAGIAVTGLTLLGKGQAAEKLSALTGRIEQVNGMLKVGQVATDTTASMLDKASGAAEDLSGELEQVAQASETATRAQVALASATAQQAIVQTSEETSQALTETVEQTRDYQAAAQAASEETRILTAEQKQLSQAVEESESHWAAWTVAATAVTVGLALYGAYSAVSYAVGLVSDAVEAGAEAMADGAEVAATYAAQVTGLSQVYQALSEEGLASVAALESLSRELGLGKEAFAVLDRVATDYKVSGEQAEAVMRRLIDVIEGQGSAAKEARAVLEAYGVSLEGLTAKDWPALLDRFSQALDGTRNSTQKTRDAMAVLGSEGTAWLEGIAAGAGDMAHAVSEADRIMMAVNERIVASQEKIAEGPDPTWWDEITKRWDKMTTLTDTFKAQQAYALLDVTLAWEEYKEGVASMGEVWDALTASAEKYFDAVNGSLVVPDPQQDSRPDAPRRAVPHWQENPVTDSSLEVYQEELELRKLAQENWTSWSLEKERDYWVAMRKEWVDAQETSSAWQIENSPVKEGLDQKVDEANRALAQRDQSVDGYRRVLEERKAAEDRVFSTTKAEELAFWQDRLATAEAGSKLYLDIEKEIATLRNAMVVEAHDLEIAHLRDRMDALRGDAAAQVSLAQQMADKTAQLYGQGSARHQQALLEVARTKRALGEQSLEQDLAQLRARQEASAGDAAAQLLIAREIAARIGQTYGERSARHRQALLDIERAERAHADQMRRVTEIQSQAQMQAINDRWTAERDALAFQAQIGMVSAVEEAERLRALEAEKFRLEQENRRQSLANIKSDVIARKQALLDIEAAERRHALTMAQLDRQQALAKRAQLREWTSPVMDTTKEMISGITNGTLAADQLVSSFLQGLVGKYIAHLGEIAAEWITQHVLMAAFSEVMAAEEVSTQVAAGAATMAATKAQAIGEISAAAGAGAAWAMASVAAIPVTGWAMAPGVGAAHYAQAMGYMASVAIPAAEKGWWDVPNDTLAVIHQKEMVMPAHLAEGVRQMVDRSGSQPGEGSAVSANAPSVTFAPTVVGLDRQSVQTMLRREAALLASLVQGQERKFQKRR